MISQSNIIHLVNGSLQIHTKLSLHAYLTLGAFDCLLKCSSVVKVQLPYSPKNAKKELKEEEKKKKAP